MLIFLGIFSLHTITQTKTHCMSTVVVIITVLYLAAPPPVLVMVAITSTTSYSKVAQFFTVLMQVPACPEDITQIVVFWNAATR